MMKLDKTTDLQFFFINGDKTFIHKKVTEIEEKGGWIYITKENGMQAIVRSENVTQILEVV